MAARPTIPMFAATQHKRHEHHQLQAAFKRVMHHGRYVCGPELRAFEIACAEYLCVRHAIGVNSGSCALQLALLSLNLNPGDEVICPSYAPFSTASSIVRIGASPVFVDIEPGTYTLDASQLRPAITPRSRAIIAVHRFGRTANMPAILTFAKRHNLRVIEDVSQACGGQLELHGSQQRLGSIGDIGCFSFLPQHNLSGFGDGGLLVCQDDCLAAQALRWRQPNECSHDATQWPDTEFRLNTLQAALLLQQLPGLDRSNLRRQRLAQQYQRNLAQRGLSDHDSDAPLRALHSAPQQHVYQQFVIELRDATLRPGLQQILQKAHIETHIPCPTALHEHAYFAAYPQPLEPLRRSTHAAQHTLALPLFPSLSPSDIDTVCATLERAMLQLTQHACPAIRAA